MSNDNPKTNHPGILRLLGCILYDWFIILGLLMLLGFIAVGINKLLTGKDAIASGNPFFLLWNLFIIYVYFAGFWLGKRQTVGMKAWRVHLITTDQTSLAWTHVTLRFFSAIPAWGLALAGVLWRYTNSERRTWQDRYSQTRLVYTPKSKG